MCQQCTVSPIINPNGVVRVHASRGQIFAVPVPCERHCNDGRGVQSLKTTDHFHARIAVCGPNQDGGTFAHLPSGTKPSSWVNGHAHNFIGVFFHKGLQMFFFVVTHCNFSHMKQHQPGVCGVFDIGTAIMTAISVHPIQF